MKIMHDVNLNKESIYDDNFNCTIPSIIVVVVVVVVVIIISSIK